MFELERKENKKLKSFNYDELEPSVQSRHGKPEQCKQRKCIYQNLETGPIYTKIPMPYLDNPSEEAISENNQIKEYHETSRLLNEEIRMFQLKHLKP